MGTTSEKLTYLNETKSKLKSAINGIGGELTSDSTFRSYPDEIDNAWNKVFEQLPHVEGTGESITLNNTIQAKMKVNLKGNTSQVSYSGKNLLSVNDYTLEVYKTINIETISAGTYTFSGNVVSSDTDASTCLVIFRNGSTSVLTKYVSRGDFSISITLGNSIDNITIYAGSNYNNSVGDTATYKNMMISVNGETYEPYCGGTPSPNPSYPQDIHSVSGDNNITISNSDNTQSATYPINLGTYELNKIGDYQDYFYKNVVGASDYSSDRELNAWYLKKNIGKITINVSTASDWAYINGAFQSNSAVPSDIVDISSSLNAYTNTFTYEYHASGITGNLSNGAFGWNSSKKITFKIDNMTSKQD